MPQCLKKACRYGVKGIIAILLLLTIGSVTPRRWSYVAQQRCDVKIFIASNGLHTNIIVPVATPGLKWSHSFLSEVGDRPTASFRYLSFGWGDREVYLHTPTLADLTGERALKALFSLHNPSVMYVQGYDAIPQNWEIKCVGLNQANYRELTQFIVNSFQRGPQGKPIYLQQGYVAQSGFYVAQGSYSLINTCNSWTAEGLNQADVNTPLWGALAPMIMLHLPNHCNCES
jgi:uncharacterized protein (TIGR02117 family)